MHTITSVIYTKRIFTHLPSSLSASEMSMGALSRHWDSRYGTSRTSESYQTYIHTHIYYF